MTLTCTDCKAPNRRALPYDMTLIDWCHSCGALFGGDGKRLFRPPSDQALVRVEGRFWLTVWTEDGHHEELTGTTPAEVWQKRDELEQRLGKKLDHFALHY